MPKPYLDTYLARFDELNALTMDILTTPDKRKAVDAFEDLLVMAYVEGFAGAEYMIGVEGEIDDGAVKSALQKSYDGETIQAKMEQYYAEQSLEKAHTLLESEWHRVYGQAQYDLAKASGLDLKKVWQAVDDEKTRESHFILSETEVGIDDYFYSISGDKAKFPGGFKTAEENANCRCWVEYRQI